MQIKKALYGMKQAPRAWCEWIDQHLPSLKTLQIQIYITR